MIKSENLNKDFKESVKKQPGGERVMNCYLCGTCTAGCPVSEISVEFNPRKIMREVLIGMKDEVLSSDEIWQCSQCHTCVAHCPQDARFADIIRVLRKMAVDEGYASKDLLDKIESLDNEMQKTRSTKVKALLEK